MLPRAALASGAALVATLALASAAAALPPGGTHSLAPGAPDSLTRALEGGRVTEGRYALERARALFRRSDVAARFGAIAPSPARAATLVLRDLALRLDELPPAERRLASRLLARPDDGNADPQGHGYTVPSRVDCSGNVCVHWVESTDDAPPLADADADTVPDQVELAQAKLAEVWAAEIDRLGYRPPLADESSANHGPDGRIDVYLVDVGSETLYGYCTSDDPRVGGTRYVASAYCVLDNDFAPGQFDGAPAEASLSVTAAHEFFHAIQFGYDYLEDGWLLEATATWMEDEVYDSVDDNLGYLWQSQLTDPSVPLDLGPPTTHPRVLFQYGAFVFFRFLSEREGAPDVVRRIWELADAAAGAPDHHSSKAIDRALAERGATLRATFRDFAATNLVPDAFYEEGAAYPAPEPARTVTLAAGASAGGSVVLDHLTSWYGSFRPAPGLRSGARLTVSVDGPRRWRGAEAALVTIPVAGRPTQQPFRLDADGNASLSVAFNRSLEAVVLVLSNGSARLACWRGTPYACQGRPLDDNRTFRYRARVTGS
ncbi:MAG: hypothetical protein IT201_00495 [Thermoleophilia bacterium]|nr:hypothetical protein [Thermoleophilia bacterium]